jgi:hypothetical protein
VELGGLGTDLVPVEESFHVDGDLALLLRREGGDAGGGGGWADGRGGAEVEEGVSGQVAPAQEDAWEEEAAAGGGAAAAERHFSRARAAAVAACRRRYLGAGLWMGFVPWFPCFRWENVFLRNVVVSRKRPS